MYDDGLLIGFVMLGYGKTGHEDDPEIAENNYCLCLTLNCVTTGRTGTYAIEFSD